MTSNARFAMAVHVLAVLALQDGSPVSSEFLSVSVNTNPVVIRRLLLYLQAANLVRTRKGPRAGSRLSRPAASINLAQIYRAVECASLFELPHKRPNRRCPVGHCIQGILRHVFTAARQALERDLAGTTLAAIMSNIPIPGPIPDSQPGHFGGKRLPGSGSGAASVSPGQSPAIA